MINENTVKDFCKDYSNIDNYEEAVNDNTKTWVCHHILGEILTREEHNKLTCSCSTIRRMFKNGDI